ncbi:sensor domain-containing protein [Neobacillus sp. LXY-4]|uniref:sensor domain-containing protein n=1 Tax=Neobacillus sp. LXY-4 TaxID=3379826 RepID=UPI003EE01196
MKNPQLSLSVPKLLAQMILAYIIGFILHHQFVDEWIHRQNFSDGLEELLVFTSFLFITAPIFYLIVYRYLNKKSKEGYHFLQQYNQLMEILDDSPIGGFVYGKDGFEYVNKKYCQIVGVKEKDIIGKRFLEAKLFDDETNKLLSSNAQKRFHHQFVPDYYTVSSRQKNNATLSLEFRSKLGNLNGRPVIFGTVIDVTEKMNLEISLKKSEQLYRRLFEANMDIALILDKKGTIVEVNKAGEDAFGYEKSEIIGQSFNGFIFEQGRPEAWDVFDKVLQGQSIRYETKVIGKKNQQASIAISIMPIYLDEEITGAFAYVRDITVQREHLNTIQKMAYYDSLTGLPNRHYFTEEFNRLIDEAGSKHKRAALLYLDLDRLKMVNDNLGHLAGDKLLQMTSCRFKEVIKERGFISRLGGDEFTVIVQFFESIEEVIAIADDIITSFVEPFGIEGSSIQSKVSIGIALFPEHGDSYKGLIQAADNAMFHAKRLGGNQYKIFNSAYSSHSKKLFEFENDFSRAIENQEFFLVYQPKFDADIHTIRGVEALLRWNHSQKGEISPGDFIPMAEATGLIVPLGEWVLREACRQAKAWEASGFAPFRIAVNVSALQFQQTNFPDKVSEILAENDLDPNWLEIEIPEGTLMEENEVVHFGVSRLKEMGIHIALDHFGTGYSSFKYLKQFPLHTLKIDRSFIERVHLHKQRAAIVQAIIQLGQGLGIQVVAEGVETADELAFLQNQGIDEVQGYYISKPLPPAQLEKLIPPQH